VKKALLAMATAVLALLVSPAFGQSSSLYFNGTAQGNRYCGGPDGCVQTGFFDGSINGVNVGPSQPGGPGMISDDYNDYLWKGEKWRANGIEVSTLNATNIGQDTFFGTSIGLGGYAKLAYLVNQMLTTGGLTNAQLSAYSQALWYITGGVTWNELNASARNLVNAAAAYVNTNGTSLAKYTNLWLYVPNGPREMWGDGPMNVPEGGQALTYLLVAGASCFGAIFLRRQSRVTHRV